MVISPADKAISAEALNRYPGLSPAARRLSIELLNRTDKRTGKCWPSESRLAEALGYSQRTIISAKAELKAKGLLSWECRGGHQTPLYELAWEVLKVIAAGIKARVKAAFTAPKIAESKTRTPTQNKAAAPPPKPVPAVRLGKQFSSSYLTLHKNISSKGGFWKAPGTPQKQFLSDPQLDARACSRLWAAIRSLGHQHIATLTETITEATEAAAVKAERYKPGTGLATLRDLIARGAVA